MLGDAQERIAGETVSLQLYFSVPLDFRGKKTGSRVLSKLSGSRCIAAKLVSLDLHFSVPLCLCGEKHINSKVAKALHSRR